MKNTVFKMLLALFVLVVALGQSAPVIHVDQDYQLSQVDLDADIASEVVKTVAVSGSGPPESPQATILHTTFVSTSNAVPHDARVAGSARICSHLHIDPGIVQPIRFVTNATAYLSIEAQEFMPEKDPDPFNHYS